MRSDNISVVELLLKNGASANLPGPTFLLTVACDRAMVERLLSRYLGVERRAAFWRYVHYGRRDLASLLAHPARTEREQLSAGLAL